MTGADLLGRMEVLDNELRTGSGQVDEARALVALDMAQSFYESTAAGNPRIASAASTLTTTASQETTTWPSTLLRLDSLWMIDTDATPDRPLYELDQILSTGKHAIPGPWPVILLSLPVQSPGRPFKFWADRTNFYWYPFPDAVYTLRAYGMSAATNLTTRAITFGHPDLVAEPIASFACKLLAMGVKDPSDELTALAAMWFSSAIKALTQYTRQRPAGRHFRRVHST